jgi:hypothetical protein
LIRGEDPRSRIDKLDVKPGSRVAVISVRDAAFVEELRDRARRVALRVQGSDYDLIFYRADKPAALDRLRDLSGRIVPNGAVWVITPRGRPEIGHDTIVRAAKAAGLIDVKTARFSETHTALKLMIPRALRG